MYVYLNSRLIPAAAATVSVFDRGFAFGDSLIETLRILEGHPVFFNEHLLRMRRSMTETGFQTALDAEGLRNQAVLLAELNGVVNGRLRIQLSRGTPEVFSGVDPDGELTPTLLLTVEAFPGYPEEFYLHGAECVTVPANRGHYARYKSASLMPTILARLEATKVGAWESIFLGGHGRLLEGSFTNIFFLRGGALQTAGEDQPLLPGVVRDKIISLADRMGLAIKYEAPKAGELKSGEDAAFLTSSLLGVCPVRRIDEKQLRLEIDLCGRLAAGLRELELTDAGDAGA